MREQLEEFTALLRERNIRGVFALPTKNPVLQFVRYSVTGMVSFAADALTLWLLTTAGLYYLVSAAAAFIVGLAVNYLMTKKLVFPLNPARVGRGAELVSFTVIALIGLGLTEALMYFFTDIVLWHYMISKVVSALIVFTWNFTAKKFILYGGHAK